MVFEISDIVKEESEKLTLTEKLGFGLVTFSLLPVVPYIYNRLISKEAGTGEILNSIADHAGNVPHIIVSYLIGQYLATKFKNKKLGEFILGGVVIYHVFGEIFHSEFAPNFPKILYGTCDVKDIPLTLSIGLGLYLFNKNR